MVCFQHGKACLVDTIRGNIVALCTMFPHPLFQHLKETKCLQALHFSEQMERAPNVRLSDGRTEGHDDVSRRTFISLALVYQ
jgi:hypothetical protein